MKCICILWMKMDRSRLGLKRKWLFLFSRMRNFEVCEVCVSAKIFAKVDQNCRSPRKFKQKWEFSRKSGKIYFPANTFTEMSILILILMTIFTFFVLTLKEIQHIFVKMLQLKISLFSYISHTIFVKIFSQLRKRLFYTLVCI